MSVMSRTRSRCSQPTYEELKQLFNVLVNGSLEGSQPTYEELKPRMNRMGQLEVVPVLSLPMRN